MDPDSERCRRTDGKKWRCRRNVVTGQKYCERHMHRGRLRSRKLVETSQLITASKAAPLNNSTDNISEISNTTSSNPNLVNSVTRTRTSNVDARIMGTITNLPARCTVGCVNATATTITTAVHTDSTISAATMGTNKSGSNKNGNTNDIDDKEGDCGSKANLKNANSRGSSGRNSTNASSATTQELDFSPKSVLQVQGCSSSCLYRSHADIETARCRRTDGKKWQCRRDVVPNEKYCKMHMHRGSKKRREASLSLANLSDTPDISTGTRLQHTTIVPNKGDHINLNSSLSLSISENPRLEISDDMSDTTISDTLVASFEDTDFSS